MDCSEAQKNFQKPQKKFKKVVDSGREVCYYSQAPLSEGVPEGESPKGASEGESASGTLKTIQREMEERQ
jgi:hypothetical protein